MPSYPKYAAAVEWAGFVPIIGFMTTDLFPKKIEHLLFVALHAAAVLCAAAGIATDTHMLTAAGVATAISCWIYLIIKLNYGAHKPESPPELKIVEMLSPVSYVLAYPLIFTPQNRRERIVGIVLLLMHIITVPLIAVLMWATELHRAWGCYGSQRSLRDYDKGMCSQWNVDQIEICRDLQKQKPPNVDCSSETTAFDFFGVLLHRIVQLQLISMTIWVHSMMVQYYFAKRKSVKLQ